MFVDVSKEADGTSTNWVAESGVLDLFLLLGPTPRQVSPSFQLPSGLSVLQVCKSRRVAAPRCIKTVIHDSGDMAGRLHARSGDYKALISKGAACYMCSNYVFCCTVLNLLLS